MFCRAMQSVERRYAMASRLSACLSVGDVGVPWSYIFDFFENNYTKISLYDLRCNESSICSKVIISKIEIPGGIGDI